MGCAQIAAAMHASSVPPRAQARPSGTDTSMRNGAAARLRPRRPPGVCPLSEALRNPESREPSAAASELREREREHAEAEAAVAAVMGHVAQKAARAERQAVHASARPRPLKPLLLLGLAALNLYLWLGDPQWLRFKGPPMPTYQYYQDGYRMAAYIQAQRVEDFRRRAGRLPQRVEEVRNPVRGVSYTRVSPTQYQVTAGRGQARVVYDSGQPIGLFVGRSLARLGLLTSGVGR